LFSGILSDFQKIRRLKKYKFRQMAYVKLANYSGIAKVIPFVYHCAP